MQQNVLLRLAQTRISDLNHVLNANISYNTRRGADGKSSIKGRVPPIFIFICYCAVMLYSSINMYYKVPKTQMF